jgi:ribosomal protein L37AE/L43A
MSHVLFPPEAIQCPNCKGIDVKTQQTPGSSVIICDCAACGRSWSVVLGVVPDEGSVEKERETSLTWEGRIAFRHVLTWMSEHDWDFIRRRIGHVEVSPTIFRGIQSQNVLVPVGKVNLKFLVVGSAQMRRTFFEGPVDSIEGVRCPFCSRIQLVPGEVAGSVRCTSCGQIGPETEFMF